MLSRFIHESSRNIMYYYILVTSLLRLQREALIPHLDIKTSRHPLGQVRISSAAVPPMAAAHIQIRVANPACFILYDPLLAQPGCGHTTTVHTLATTPAPHQRSSMPGS